MTLWLGSSGTLPAAEPGGSRVAALAEAAETDVPEAYRTQRNPVTPGDAAAVSAGRRIAAGCAAPAAKLCPPVEPFAAATRRIIWVYTVDPGEKGVFVTIPATIPVGEIIRRDPERLPLAPHMHPPYLRLSEPYDLFISAGCTLQLDRVSMLENLGPKATHVEVLMNRVADATYVILVPRNDPADPRVETLNSRSNSRAAIIRTAGDVLIAGGVVMQPGQKYYMRTTIAELDGFGWVVVANWNAATHQPPRPGAYIAGQATAATGAEVATGAEAATESGTAAAAGPAER